MILLENKVAQAEGLKDVINLKNTGRLGQPGPSQLALELEVIHPAWKSTISKAVLSQRLALPLLKDQGRFPQASQSPPGKASHPKTLCYIL